MASENIGRGPIDKEIIESAGNAPKQGESARDVEVGQETIDIDRIEKVYR